MELNEEKLCQGKDVLERINYLYQASRLIAGTDKALAAYYGNVMVGCAKKSVLRMDPDIKRTICKNCQSPLIPGDTARVRLVSKPEKAIKWTCLLCKKTRRIPTKKGYNLWINEPESTVQIFDYTPRNKIVTSCGISSTKSSPAKNEAMELDRVDHEDVFKHSTVPGNEKKH